MNRKNTKPILWLDMDQVIVDFLSSPRIPAHEKHLYNHPEIFQAGFFAELLPNPGAIVAVNKLLASEKYDVRILTKPVAKNPHSYSEKAQWIINHLPELGEKITMTHDKLSILGDFLVDDDLRWENFSGNFIHFDPKRNSVEMWAEVLSKLL